MGRYSSKPFNSLWNKSWNEKVDMTIIDKVFITDLAFDEQTNRLEFIIKNYHRQPRITRYVTSNYQKTPVYEDYSERTKIIKKFNKIISPIRFVNEEILRLKLDKTMILAIIDKIGVIPEWRKKELLLEKIDEEINLYQKRLRNYKTEKKPYFFKPTNLVDTPGNFWLRCFFGFFSFFLSFIGYVSKKQASENKKINEANKKFNADHKLKIDEINLVLLNEISQNNNVIQAKIADLKIKYESEKSKPIVYENVDSDGWIDLKVASQFAYPYLMNKIGIYIIWNKTKNKYYVGESKNIGRRMTQQFKDGEVKNVIFAKDWYEGDRFFYKYHFCETKDELDALKNQYIDEYNAFEAGYNLTKGGA